MEFIRLSSMPFHRLCSFALLCVCALPLSSASSLWLVFYITNILMAYVMWRLLCSSSASSAHPAVGSEAFWLHRFTWQLFCGLSGFTSSFVSSSTALRSCSLHYAVAVRRLSSTSPLGRTVRQLPGFTVMLGIVFVALRVHQLHCDLTIILRPFGFTSSPGSGSPVHRLHRLAWQ